MELEMRSFDEIKEAYEAANAKLAALIREPLSLEEIEAILPVTPEERAALTEDEQATIQLREGSYKNLMDAHQDELLFRQVTDHFNKIESWFEVLSEQTFTFNQKGFVEARDAVEKLKREIQEERETYLQSGSTTEGLKKFNQNVGESLNKYTATIHANHDISHDMYRELQVFVKGLIESIENAFSVVSQKMGFSKGELPKVSSWIKPEETTRSLFSDSMVKLGRFFQPNVPGADRDDNDKDNDKDIKHRH